MYSEDLLSSCEQKCICQHGIYYNLHSLMPPKVRRYSDRNFWHSEYKHYIPEIVIVMMIGSLFIVFKIKVSPIIQESAKAL